MNIVADIAKGERLTFLELFQQKHYDVEIPIIQRDYAQGRASSREVREVFLDALFNYLEEGLPHRDLDFIYGSVERQDDGLNRFIPLDGQQRLTTLFLLHWYLATLTGNQAAFQSTFLRRQRSRFTYETRSSSQEFCDALVAAVIDLGQLLPPDEGKQNRLSKTLRDRGWYYLSWDQDPTVQSMLTMLDSIHARFHSRPEFYGRLTSRDNRVITFLMLPLQEFGLTDDLYIKMNSRGKPLSPFENFKARYEQHIDELPWKNAGDYTLDFGDGPVVVSRRTYFAHQIDTTWADLFWNYRGVGGPYSSFDKELMNFIRVILSAAYALQKSAGKDETLEYLFGTQVVSRRPDYSDVISYHNYQQFGALSKKAFKLLTGTFDCLSNGNQPIRVHLPDTFHFDEQVVFRKVLDHSLSQEQRVQFYAYTGFLIEHKGDITGLTPWMRVIYNLTVNTVIDGAEEIASALRSVKELLPYSADILNQLTRLKTTAVDFFYRRQVQEEQLKAHLILKTPEWGQAILAAERHGYFLGQILFLFEYSGVLEWFEQHGHCNWSVAEDLAFLSAFQHYTASAGAVFATIGTAANKDFIWERAVLTKGDYLPWLTAWRRNFLIRPRDRDYSWKRLLRLPPPSAHADDIYQQAQQRDLVKQVLDDPIFNREDLRGSLTLICKNRPSDWRRYFIRKPALIGYCSQGYIRFFQSEHNIRLYKHSQQNHTQVELYTYDLWLRELENKPLGLPFDYCYYQDVRTGDEQPGIRFTELKLGRKTYRMELDYQSEGTTFEFRFYKEGGKTSLEAYQAELTTVLEAQELEWYEQDKHFWCLADTATKAMEKLLALSKALAELKATL
ncbi:DUF262 domain-containing protein [Mucilaginibacter ximonensis]|uniref:DUF262 domain-containing protein n=1 Tax=Mucilaginibacter ximonensis TaxID=538021 RepID=A0ABW5YF95_9SPHI